MSFWSSRRHYAKIFPAKNLIDLTPRVVIILICNTLILLRIFNVNLIQKIITSTFACFLRMFYAFLPTKVIAQSLVIWQTFFYDKFF